MHSVIEAQQRILSSFSKTRSSSIPLDQILGRVLAEDIFASTDLPPFENSGMDGFAVQAKDTLGSTPDHPVFLKIIEDIPAGYVSKALIQTGQTARIMTGAAMPNGADGVVIIEDTNMKSRNPGELLSREIAIFHPVGAGSNIRMRGEDIRAGQKIIGKGTRLRPQDIGMLAMMGMAVVQVQKQPRLALFSSGNELLSIDAPPEKGKIRDANMHTLGALAQKEGAEVIRLGVASDDPKSIEVLLEKAFELNADLIVSSAGVSIGAFDYIKQVVEDHGTLDFWRVNVRPGKPFAFGKYRGIPFFGLPGNPVSAFVSFKLFVSPVLNKMNGITPENLPRETATLMEEVTSDGRESYLRATITIENGSKVARLSGHQGSGNLLSLVQANALLIVPSGVKSLPAGIDVETIII
jgi:molybdopterin molybdotransferase